MRVTVRLAEKLPRRKRWAIMARSCASNASKPGATRSRRSSDLPLTLLTSHTQEMPRVSPSARANPVMLVMFTPAVSSCQAPSDPHPSEPSTHRELASGRACENQRRVGSAEAEGIGEHVPHAALLRLPWHQIDVAGRRGIVEVQGRRHYPVADSEDREDRLDTPRGTEQMSDRRLRRGHR